MILAAGAGVLGICIYCYINRPDATAEEVSSLSHRFLYSILVFLSLDHFWHGFSSASS